MEFPDLIDRETDLAALARAWSEALAGRPQLVAVWGRRRVGKTYLLSEFVRGKRAVFFGATQQAQAVELARLADAVRRNLGDHVVDLAGGGFSSWEAALRFLAALAADEPLAVLLDEVPYLARSTAGFASIVQVVWDHLGPGARLLLAITGSAVGAMEHMLGAGAALRGRPTLRLRLDPLDPVAAPRRLGQEVPRFIERQRVARQVRRDAAAAADLRHLAVELEPVATGVQELHARLAAMYPGPPKKMGTFLPLILPNPEELIQVSHVHGEVVEPEIVF